MKIALLSHGFADWGGGIDFLRHIASSVASSEQAGSVDKTVILPAEDIPLRLRRLLYPAKTLIKQLLRREVPKLVFLPTPSKRHIRAAFADLAGDFEILYSGSTYESQLRAARHTRADVLLPCFEPPRKGFEQPWIGYLYDFQHRHLPEFFTEQEINNRNREFARMLSSGGHIIVNARAVVNDARLFYPHLKAQLHALPFSPSPTKAWLDSDLDLRNQYELTDPYFLICNQFWKHKDHATAFRAFAHYVQNGGRALLVCTGGTSDYRFPGHFEFLTRLLTELEIAPRVRILGYIPKLHQIALLKQANAVIQPTLFEGGPGGGAAYDAIALGVPVIASNIPVNLEIDCGNVTFFQAGDDLSLADALLHLGDESFARRASNDVLWQAGLGRRKRCGDFILDVVMQATRRASQS